VHDVLAPLAMAIGSRVVAVYGGADMNKQIQALAAGVEAIIATPGRLIDLVDRKEVELGGLEIVVVDEADRMADMGFLPQVEWLLRHVDSQHQTLLFSATLDGVVDGLIKRYQHDPVYHEVESRTVTVEEMQHLFLHVHEMDRVKVASAIANGAHRTMIFSRTKRGADRLARQLSDEGIAAAAIHGDLPQSIRERGLKRFTDGQIQVLVATDVAARGIHVDDVDIVIHYDPPEDHKTYLHRSGRTARAGAEGVVVTFVLWDQELEVRRMQKRIGIEQPIEEVFSNDPRLADVGHWDTAVTDTDAASAAAGA
jgi:superfamily II DNA/RNA helicase